MNKSEARGDEVRIAQAYRRLLALLADNTSLGTIAMTAAQLAIQLLEADGASVTQIEGNEAIYVASVGTAAHLLYRRLRLSDSFTGLVVDSRAPLVFDPRSAPASSVARA